MPLSRSISPPLLRNVILDFGGDSERRRLRNRWLRPLPLTECQDWVLTRRPNWSLLSDHALRGAPASDLQVEMVLASRKSPQFALAPSTAVLASHDLVLSIMRVGAPNNVLAFFVSFVLVWVQERFALPPQQASTVEECDAEEPPFKCLQETMRCSGKVAFPSLWALFFQRSCMVFMKTDIRMVRKFLLDVGGYLLPCFR